MTIFAALKSYLMSSRHLSGISRPYTVVLGVDTLSGNEDTKQEFTSVRYILHPNYDGQENDIMLLQVSGVQTLSVSDLKIPF